jgi:hypothetical protein
MLWSNSTPPSPGGKQKHLKDKLANYNTATASDSVCFRDDHNKQSETWKVNYVWAINYPELLAIFAAQKNVTIEHFLVYIYR